jgi:hypothetical protein
MALTGEAGAIVAPGVEVYDGIYQQRRQEEALEFNGEQAPRSRKTKYDRNI